MCCAYLHSNATFSTARNTVQPKQSVALNGPKHLLLLPFYNWLGTNKNSVPLSGPTARQAGPQARGDSVAGVCPRREQLPTQNSLGSTFMPKGLRDLLVWIMDSDDCNKTPRTMDGDDCNKTSRAMVVTSPKKRSLSLAESYFGPHLHQLPPLGLGSWGEGGL